jgi:prepilin-type N-terminal cleavage/methylation domain-containing protein
MSTPRIASRREHGYTLAELLVVCAVLGLVMAGVLTLYMTGTTVALTGQNKTEAQQGARGTLLIEEDLRQAGYGFPANTTANPVFSAASATSVTFWADLTNSTTTLSAAAASGANVLTVTSGAGFAASNVIYVINQGVWETRTVASATATTVTLTAGLTNAYPAGAQVGLPRQITYSWDGVGTLSRNGGGGAQPAVTGVTAFALSYYDATETLIPPATLAANLANIRRVVIGMTVQSAAVQNRGTFTLNAAVRPRNL